MRILITGSSGFVGKNLAAALENLRNGRDHTHSELDIQEVYLCGRGTAKEQLQEACQNADFVFHLAGVNRPETMKDYLPGNLDPLAMLLEQLSAAGNCCPVMLASSTQASLVGRYAGSAYGQAKLACEKLLRSYAAETGAKVLIYRFPNIFGKWCRPSYNSVIATFCDQIAHDRPMTIYDPAVELELLYIDDLIKEMLAALVGREHHCSYHELDVRPDPEGDYCYVPTTYRITLGKIAEWLECFHKQPETLILPEIPAGSFEKKLYSTYLSYLPIEKAVHQLKMKFDNRGSFTEILRTKNSGQFSVNILLPGITKGQHWHHSKWEIFVVVAGHGLIQERKINSDEVLNFEVSGEKLQAVYMLPGYTHSIINLSHTENLVTLMWANEPFDSAHPDTYYEPVQSEEER